MSIKGTVLQWLQGIVTIGSHFTEKNSPTRKIRLSWILITPQHIWQSLNNFNEFPEQNNLPKQSSECSEGFPKHTSIEEHQTFPGTMNTTLVDLTLNTEIARIIHKNLKKKKINLEGILIEFVLQQSQVIPQHLDRKKTTTTKNPNTFPLLSLRIVVIETKISKKMKSEGDSSNRIRWRVLF